MVEFLYPLPSILFLQALIIILLCVKLFDMARFYFQFLIIGLVFHGSKLSSPNKTHCEIKKCRAMAGNLSKNKFSALLLLLPKRYKKSPL